MVWRGAQGTVEEGQAGLQCLATDVDLWKLHLRQLEDGKPLLRAAQYRVRFCLRRNRL